MASQKNSKNLFLRFLHSEDSKVSIARDVIFALLFVFIILISLWAYTGQWFNAQPMVAVESNSMMHLDEPFGRIGTIDSGDMVLLVKIEGKEDIVPRGNDFKGARAEQNPDNYHYGDYGDVIVYRPYGNPEETQIIHRAICWVEYNEVYNTYTVEDYDIYNQTTINIPEVGLYNYRSDNPHSGYITKGDNVTTNKEADQTSSSICDEPIKLEWISGKARGELPWIGIINLLFNDITTNDHTLNNVPRDSFDCLLLLIESLILIPIGMDILSYYKGKQEELMDKNQKQVSDLASLTVFYWGAIIGLFLVSYFFIKYPLADFYHLIIILLIHIVFLFLLKQEGRILRAKNMQKWLLITAFTGPIGMTLFYMNYQKLKN